ncbi:MAG: hypothetical protein JWQ21_4130 [Herminiimonas sp.]|nr:hypothetical protein [Herminiimonas sp.]
MKNLCMTLTTGLLLMSVSAWAQMGIPDKSDPSVKTPSDPGIQKNPDSSPPPSDPGSVVVPPKTDPEAIITDPAKKNIDPGITGATKGIDKENRKKSEDKQSKGKPKPQ